MATLNEEIMSELNAISDSNTEMKVFLMWLVEFERERSDKAKYSYQQEILKKLDSIFNNPND